MRLRRKHLILAIFPLLLILAWGTPARPWGPSTGISSDSINTSYLNPSLYSSIGVRQELNITRGQNITLPKAYYLDAGKTYVAELQYTDPFPRVDIDIDVTSLAGQLVRNSTASQGMDEFLIFEIMVTGIYLVHAWFDAGDSEDGFDFCSVDFYIYEYLQFSGELLETTVNMVGKSVFMNDRVEMYHVIKVSGISGTYPLTAVASFTVQAPLDLYEVRMFPVIGYRNYEINEIDNPCADYNVYRASHRAIDPMSRNQHEYIIPLGNGNYRIPYDWQDMDFIGVPPSSISVTMNGSIKITDPSVPPYRSKTIGFGWEIIIVIIAEWNSGPVTVRIDIPGGTGGTEPPANPPSSGGFGIPDLFSGDYGWILAGVALIVVLFVCMRRGGKKSAPRTTEKTEWTIQVHPKSQGE
ncbi:MAG: hypothetical protein ACTSUE_03475 [Promethearchaeota archaeon]